MLAVECMLSEVKPVASSGDGSWGERATAWFRDRTLNRKFTVQVGCFYAVLPNLMEQYATA